MSLSSNLLLKKKMPRRSLIFGVSVELRRVIVELPLTVVAWNFGITSNSSSKDHRNLPLDHLISKSSQLVQILKHEQRKGKLKFNIIESYPNVPKRSCNDSSVKFSAPHVFRSRIFIWKTRYGSERNLSARIGLLNSTVRKHHPNLSSWSLVKWFFWFDTLNCAWGRSFCGFNPRLVFSLQGDGT